MTVRAAYETKRSKLASDFGYEWACKLFGKDCIDGLPAYASGTSKGKPKGYVIWVNCTSGGWSRQIGGVLKPGLARAWLGNNPFATDREALFGNWLGRHQQVSGDRAFLFDDGRNAEIERQRVRQQDEATQMLQAANEHEAQGRAMEQNPHLARLAQKSLDMAAAIRRNFSST